MFSWVSRSRQALLWVVYAMYACSLAGCGRIGFQLLPAPEAVDASVRDAGKEVQTPPLDAMVVADATVAADVTVAVDATAVVDAMAPVDASAVPDAGVLCVTGCANANGTADCTSGACMLTCAIGFDDCDADPANGCEANTGDLSDSCGGCGLSCTNDHGSTACSAGLCSPGCAAGYGDCDGNPDNGCETSLADVVSCGACGSGCSNAHGTTACPAGACTPTCAAGYDDCDGDPDNGCETNVLNDPTHCGSCVGVCGTNGQICVNGTCEASPCTAGFGECDGDLGVTCETDLNSNVDHCNFCGNACTTLNGTPSCVSGTCGVASCAAGYDDCDGDPADCEVDLRSSVQDCGACNDPCTNAHGSTRCTASTCDPTCSNGWDDCDGNPDNGCETSLTTVSNCDGCGLTCPANGGTAICNAGVCDTRCDLTGTFALYVQGTGSWPQGGVIASGSGTFEFWMKVDAVHNGNAVSIQITECGRTVPPFGSWIVSEDFLHTYPNSLFDAGGLPSVAGTLALTDSSPDSGLSLPPIAIQLGLSMSDPVNDGWPSQASSIPSGNRVDMDGDGKPGVTAHYVSGGGYVYPRTSSSLFGYNRADRGYVAARAAFSLSGSLNGCTQSSGSANVSHNDTRVFGCRRTSGSDCNGSEADYLDSNSNPITMSGSSYAMVKVSAGASCATIRAALP